MSMDAHRYSISQSCEISAVEQLMREFKALRGEGRLSPSDFSELKEQAKRKIREAQAEAARTRDPRGDLRPLGSEE